MDGQQIGWIGGIAGSVVGAMGGLVGTYFGIKNTRGRSERMFAIRWSIGCWLGVSIFLGCLFVVPFPWRTLLWLAYIPLLLWFIRMGNERLALARASDSNPRLSTD